MSTGWQVGIDIGGTFTDVVAFHSGNGAVFHANVRLAKGDRVIVDTCGGGDYGLQKASPETP